jgi:hypothetical protein
MYLSGFDPEGWDPLYAQFPEKMAYMSAFVGGLS